MNGNDKAAIVVIGLILIAVTFLMMCMTYNEYLDYLVSKDALSKGYDQVWDENGKQIIWQKSNPSIP